MGKFINPFSDWGFKHIFGQEMTKDLLIQFLNDLLEGEHAPIRDLHFLNNESQPETRDGRCIVYDVFCTTDKGERFIVEMQNRYQEYFVDRSLFYAARAIVNQGQKSGWDYHLLPVYTVCFMNFYKGGGTPDKFRTDVGLMDREVAQQECREGETKRPFSDNLRLIYLVLPLFPIQSEEDCQTNFERWIYILNNMQILERMPFMAQNAVFQKLAEIGDISTLSWEERQKYDESLKNLRDNIAAYKTAVKEGMAQGLAEGRAVGLAEGRAEGRAEGLEQGRVEGLEQGRAEGGREKAYEIARNLLLLGLPVETVAQASGLREEEIKGLS